MLDRQTRIAYIDSIKAFGIILVVLGHTNGLPTEISKHIYSFHMPLFFIISGLLYNKIKYDSLSWKSILIKKTKSYLIPYLVLSLINLLFQIIWKLIITKELITFAYCIKMLRGILLCISVDMNMPMCSPLWFLIALFISEIIFICIMKYMYKFRFLMSIVCLLSGLLLASFYPYYIYYKIDAGLIAVFFLMIGYTIKESKLLEFIKNNISVKIILLATGIASVFLSLINEQIGMNEGKYGNYLCFLFCSISFSLFFIALFYLLKDYRILNNKLITWLGSNTIYIMGFNLLAQQIAYEVYYYTPFLRKIEIQWYSLFIITLIICIAIVIIISLLKRMRSKLFSKSVA